MKILLRSLLYAFAPLFLLYLIAPLLIWSFPYFFQHLFFLNFVKIPGTDYNNISKHGVVGGRNFYVEIDSSPGESPVLGVWHVFPQSLRSKLPDTDSLTTERTRQLVRSNYNGILIYLHGNSFDRTAKHRCELYRILSAIDLHVLAVDYRGYGDSTGRPTEDGVVADAKAIYEYAKKMDPTKPIFFWGHSMGTGVATRTVAELSAVGEAPTALVLEAPFNNLHDVISNHPFSIPFRFLPWFESSVIRPLIRSGLVMNSDKHIQGIDCPILVFHAQDDHIIPVELGRKLVESAKSANRTIKYVEFDAGRNFFHKYIHRANELPKIVLDFFSSAQK